VVMGEIVSAWRDILSGLPQCDKWSMCLNSSKCKIMHLGKKSGQKILHRKW